MAYAIVFKPAAIRDLRKLPQDVQRRVAARIDTLATDPLPHGVEALQGEPDMYRIRVGEYRIIYKRETKALVILVVRIGHRREVYRKGR
jgi:mRNA interferase RelE/StbE